MEKDSRKSRKSAKGSLTSEAIHGEKKSKINFPKSSTFQNKKSEVSTKKKLSFKELVEAMQPSVEELEFRGRKSKETDVLHDNAKSFRCTKCHKNVMINSEKVQAHPCLGVLMCEKCCNYYGDGEFSLDSENEDKYCRWCGEGGTLFGCSKCICGFCMVCIRKHFGNGYLKKVKNDDDWLCFFCNPKPLWDQRYICSVAMQISENKTLTPSSEADKDLKGFRKQNSSKTPSRSSKKKKFLRNALNQLLSDSSSSSTKLKELPCSSVKTKNENSSKKRFYSTSSDDSDILLPKQNLKKKRFSSQQLEGLCEKNVNFENLKQMTLEKLERVVKLSEYQMAFGVNWSSKTLKKLADPKHINTPEDLLEECEKIKWFLSVLSTYLVEFCNSIDSVQRSLTKENGSEDANISQAEADPTGFSSVIKFLSFIISQIHTFVKKGLSLPDVLQAEIYEDNKIIGIKKNLKPSLNISSESSNNISPEISKTNCDQNKTATQLNAETEDPKDQKDESPGEDSLKLVVDQGSEFLENDSENVDSNSPAATLRDAKNDILHIIGILEHA